MGKWSQHCNPNQVKKTTEDHVYQFVYQSPDDAIDSAKRNHDALRFTDYATTILANLPDREFRALAATGIRHTIGSFADAIRNGQLTERDAINSINPIIYSIR